MPPHENAPADPPRPTIPLAYAGAAIPTRRRVPIVWVLGTVAVLALVAVLVMPTARRRQYGAADRPACARNLWQSGAACLMYAQEHGGRLPDTLNDALLTGDVAPEVFVCPMTK